MLPSTWILQGLNRITLSSLIFNSVYRLFAFAMTIPKTLLLETGRTWSNSCYTETECVFALQARAGAG